MKATVNSPVRTSDSTSNDNVSVETPFEIDSSVSAIKIEQLKTLSVLNYIIQRVLHVQNFINSFTERCKYKAVDVLAFLWSVGVKTGDLIEAEKQMNFLGLDLTAQHRDNLVRNLSGLNLEVARIEDGNCFLERLPHSFLNI